MKKVVIVTLLLVVVGSLALSQAKPGGIARQAAMGGSQAGSGLVLNPFIMDDPALMLINPAYQVAYKDYGWSNIAGGNLSGSADLSQDGYTKQNAGIAFSLGSNFNLGAIFSYDPSAVNLMGSILSNFPRAAGRSGQTIPTIQNTWELVGSMHFSALDLGLGIILGSSDDNSKTNITAPTAASSESDASASLLGFRGGLVIDIGGGSLLDASAALRMDKATDKITSNPSLVSGSGEYAASGTEFQGEARGKFKVSEKFNFVPYGLLGMLSAEPKENTPPTGTIATTTTQKYTLSAYALGVGGEVTTKNFYIAGGLSFQYAQAKYEESVAGVATTTTMTYQALPVMNLGGEWSFTDWLAGRIGYFRSMGKTSSKSEDPTGSTETSNSSGMSFPFPGGEGSLFMPGTHSSIMVGNLDPSTWDGIVTLGVGMKFGGFALDATVSDEALRRGLGLIGASDNINTFGYVTASYNFAE
jgi:hypothetical protein